MFRNSIIKFLCLTVLLLPVLSCENELPSSEYDWVIMYYVDADNDLEQFLMNDLNEIEGVDISSKKVLMVALVDRVNNYWGGDGDWTDTRAFEIGYDQNGFNNQLSSSTKRIAIESLGISENSQTELNMGDPSVLQNFVSFVYENYSAKKYMLLFTNHGNGWGEHNDLTDSNKTLMTKKRQQERFKKMAEMKHLCWDETNGGDALTIKEVRQALEQVLTDKKKLDILAMDACLMGSVEVIYEFKDLADILVASAEVVPVYGFPYTQIMEKLKNKNGPIPKTFFAKTMVEEFYDVYRNGGCIEDTQCASPMYTLAAIDTSKIEDLKISIDHYADQLIGTINNINPRYESIEYLMTANVDLYNYIGKETLADIQGQKVKEQIERLLIDYKSSYPDTRALSIYYPLHKYGVSSEYNPEALLFVKDSGPWFNFINTLEPQIIGDSLELCTTPGYMGYGNNWFTDAYQNSACNYLTNNLELNSYFYIPNDLDWFYIPDKNAQFEISLSAPEGVDVHVQAFRAQNAGGNILPVFIPIGTGGIDHGVGVDEKLVVNELEDSPYGYFVIINADGFNKTQNYVIRYVHTSGTSRVVHK